MITNNSDTLIYDITLLLLLIRLSLLLLLFRFFCVVQKLLQDDMIYQERNSSMTATTEIDVHCRTTLNCYRLNLVRFMTLRPPFILSSQVNLTIYCV